ncbi:MAG: hypothetical protein RR272_01150 [Synergistaceae bacterium]
MVKNIYILANSPGELSGWVNPVLSALSERDLEVNVIFVALPCPYASGRESVCAKSLPLVSRTLSVGEVLHGYSFDKKDSNLVLQFGGDPFFGFIVSRRLKGKWFLYGTRPRFSNFVDFYFLPDRSFVDRFVKKGISPLKYEVVGNLMVDSVVEHLNCDEVRNLLGVSSDDRLVSVLLGSRPFEYESSCSFFMEMSIEVLKRLDCCSVVMPIAPTVDEELLLSALKRSGFACEKGFPKDVDCGSGRYVHMVQENNFDVMKASTLVVALPGTNNLQVASLGTPLVMLAPLNEAENIPLDGLPGLISSSSNLGRAIKRRLVFWYNKRERFVSLPNRLSGVEIVPEHRYIMTPSMAADVVCDLLSSEEKLNSIRKGYEMLDLSRGAALKVADTVCNFFKGS